MISLKAAALVVAGGLAVATGTIFNAATIHRQNEHDAAQKKVESSAVIAARAANLATTEAYRAASVFSAVCVRFSRDEANDRADAADLAEIVARFPYHPNSQSEALYQAALKRAVRRAKARREFVKSVDCRKAMQRAYIAAPPQPTPPSLPH